MRKRRKLFQLDILKGISCNLLAPLNQIKTTFKNVIAKSRSKLWKTRTQTSILNKEWTRICFIDHLLISICYPRMSKRSVMNENDEY